MNPDQQQSSVQKEISAASRINERVELLEQMLVKPYVRDLQLLGKTVESNTTYREMRKALKLYQRVLQRGSNGESVSRISKDESISEGTVYAWIHTDQLPLALSHRSEANRNRVTKDYTIPRSASIAFAYFLGAVAGFTRPGTAHYHIRPEIPDEAIAMKVAKGFKVAVPSGASLQNHQKGSSHTYYRVDCLHLPLSRHINMVTNCHRRVPWEHVHTKKEKQSFLNGLFDLNGSIGTSGIGGITFQKTGGESLIVDVAQLLSSLGITPRVKTGHKAILFINEKADLEKILELNVFTENRQVERLQEIASRPRSRITYSAQDYRRAKKYWKAHPTENNSEVGRAVDIPSSIVRQWRSRDSKPREVVREEELKALLKGHPSHPVLLNKLFRKYGLPSDVINTAFDRYSKKEITKAIKDARTDNIPFNGNPDLFLRLLEQLRREELKSHVNEPAALASETLTQIPAASEPVSSKGVTEAEDPYSVSFQAAVLTEQQIDWLNNYQKVLMGEAFHAPHYFHALKHHCDMAPQLSMPIFTFEKFIKVLGEESKDSARMMILALISENLRGEYIFFLEEEGLLPTALFQEYKVE